ncbi:hypothetical protein BHF71_03050 [Vulcanibacillus modesticaldus]|uniref:PRC-barrel domain-containing protein n=1 Tax=Vulcanibacillus modesticaldus TaxID=337097 RepID=A0A1D2YT95_9BACI|nr:PRC-barrel domain-containing protein [Vulcanibacillus modesticaldus]OEF98918.1 hypothetical protein BHF71_03050 [Vulcanibacillus modesticaldus]
MKKIQDVLGLPVLDTSTGKKLGVVKDVYFNQRGELVGLAVESPGIFTKRSYLSFDKVGAIGDDAVTIGTERFLTSFNQNSYYSFSTGKKAYKEYPIVTTNGKELGHISDVYFQEELGKILGYEISDGFLSDVTEGRRTIQIPKKMVFGEDAIIVPSDEIKEVIFDQE